MKTVPSNTAIVLFGLVFCAAAIAQEPPGRIVFYRNSESVDYQPQVFCDGAELAAIGGSQYLEVLAPPGRHPCVAESAQELPTYVMVVSGKFSYQKVEVTGGKEHHAFLVTSDEQDFNRQEYLRSVLKGQTISLPGLQPPGDEPLPEGVSRAGVNSVGYPHCVYCPDPKYTEKGRRARIQGTVVMQVIIGADGKAGDIRFVERLGVDMDEQAANTVRAWRFEPARGPDGYPVPVLVPIEITFRFL